MSPALGGGSRTRVAAGGLAGFLAVAAIAAYLIHYKNEHARQSAVAFCSVTMLGQDIHTVARREDESGAFTRLTPSLRPGQPMPSAFPVMFQGFVFSRYGCFVDFSDGKVTHAEVSHLD